MIPTSLARILICSICLLFVSASAQVPVEKGNLRAGASRVVITPAPDAALPMSGYRGRTAGFKGIHDDLHVRAIVVEDGMSQAALIACEVIGISDVLWQRIAERLTRETAIPRDNIILAAVHTHAAPAIGTYAEPAEGDAARKRAEYIQKFEDAVLTVVRQAKANLQPAKVGFGTGKRT